MSQNVYTTVASSMVVNTDIVNARLEPHRVGPRRRQLQVTPPAGPSSADGELSRQSLVLSAEGEQPVCGWVDFVAARAELKDYASTSGAYLARYKKPFDVPEAQYRELIQKLQSVLRELQVRVELVGDAKESYAVTDPLNLKPLERRAEATSGRSPWVWLLVVLGALGALLVVARALYLL